MAQEEWIKSAIKRKRKALNLKKSKRIKALSALSADEEGATKTTEEHPAKETTKAADETTKSRRSVNDMLVMFLSMKNPKNVIPRKLRSRNYDRSLRPLESYRHAHPKLRIHGFQCPECNRWCQLNPWPPSLKRSTMATLMSQVSATPSTK